MPKPGSPQWHARLAAIQEAESKQPLGWWYLSFAGPRDWNGAVVVQARGILGAVAEADRLGINPGGEVKGARLGPSVTSLPGHMEMVANRLLSKADLEKFAGRTVKW